MAWLTSFLSSATSGARSGGDSCASASSRRRIAVSAWLTSSCRSRASRRRSSSCARMASCPERRRSSSIRFSSPLKDCERRSISSTGSRSKVSSGDGAAGSIASIRSIRRSSGRKRRCSIQRLVHKVRTIASARIRNCQRWSEIVRSSPAARLAPNRVRATSTTFAPPPGRLGSRRGGSSYVWIGMRLWGTNGVFTPYRQEPPATKIVVRLQPGRRNCRSELPQQNNLGLGLPPGRLRAPR